MKHHTTFLLPFLALLCAGIFFFALPQAAFAGWNGLEAFVEAQGVAQPGNNMTWEVTIENTGIQNPGGPNTFVYQGGETVTLQFETFYCGDSGDVYCDPNSPDYEYFKRYFPWTLTVPAPASCYTCGPQVTKTFFNAVPNPSFPCGSVQGDIGAVFEPNNPNSPSGFMAAAMYDTGTDCPVPTSTPIPIFDPSNTPTLTPTPSLSPTPIPVGSCSTVIISQSGVGGQDVTAQVRYSGLTNISGVDWFMDNSRIVGPSGTTATFTSINIGSHTLYGVIAHSAGSTRCASTSFNVGIVTPTPISCKPNGVSCSTNGECCGGDCWGGGGNICRAAQVPAPAGNCACGDGVYAPCCGDWWRESNGATSGCEGEIPPYRSCIQGLVCQAPGGDRCIRFVINGTVFVDDNEDGVRNGGEQGFQGGQVDYWYGDPIDATCGKQQRNPYGNRCLGEPCICTDSNLCGNDTGNQACRSGNCTGGICMTVSNSTTFSPDLISSTRGTGFYEFAPNNSYTGGGAKAHQIRLNVPQGYQASPLGSELKTREVASGQYEDGPLAPVDFGIVPLNYISGNVFVDNNFNRSKDAGEQNYTASAITITASDGTRSFAPTYTTGAYKVRVRPGTYIVSYTNLPTGYQMINPKNGPPPSYQVTVGSPSIGFLCNVGTAASPDASCDIDGSVVNLNFAINNIYPWFQGTGGDMRIDGGFVDKIPPTVLINRYVSLEGSALSPGIVFTGDRAYDFGQGAASVKDWIVGGTTDPDSYTSVNSTATRASHSFLTTSARLAGWSSIDLETVCTGGLSDCTLDPTLLPEGVYISSDPATTVVLNSFSVPANANKDYLFLIQGDLRIKGRITVPVSSSSTATFAVAGNITVDKDLGAPTSSSTETTLEGFFATDKSIIFERKGTVDDPCNNADGSPLDKRVNIAGVVVANAAYTTGGTFDNERNLCRDNVNPTISLTERLDMVLNAPSFIQQQNYVWREVAP